jgi:hypothetical protein
MALAANSSLVSVKAGKAGVYYSCYFLLLCPFLTPQRTDPLHVSTAVAAAAAVPCAAAGVLIQQPQPDGTWRTAGVLQRGQQQQLHVGSRFFLPSREATTTLTLLGSSSSCSIGGHSSSLSGTPLAAATGAKAAEAATKKAGRAADLAKAQQHQLQPLPLQQQRQLSPMSPLPQQQQQQQDANPHMTPAKRRRVISPQEKQQQQQLQQLQDLQQQRQQAWLQQQQQQQQQQQHSGAGLEPDLERLLQKERGAGIDAQQLLQQQQEALARYSNKQQQVQQEQKQLLAEQQQQQWEADGEDTGSMLDWMMLPQLLQKRLQQEGSQPAAAAAAAGQPSSSGLFDILLQQGLQQEVPQPAAAAAAGQPSGAGLFEILSRLQQLDGGSLDDSRLPSQVDTDYWIHCRPDGKSLTSWPEGKWMLVSEQQVDGGGGSGKGSWVASVSLQALWGTILTVWKAGKRGNVCC